MRWRRRNPSRLFWSPNWLCWRRSSSWECWRPEGFIPGSGKDRRRLGGTAALGDSVPEGSPIQPIHDAASSAYADYSDLSLASPAPKLMVDDRGHVADEPNEAGR